MAGGLHEHHERPLGFTTGRFDLGQLEDPIVIAAGATVHPQRDACALGSPTGIDLVGPGSDVGASLGWSDGEREGGEQRE